MKRKPQQDVSKRGFTRPMWKRGLCVLAGLCVFYAAIGGRLATVQIGEHEIWQARAAEQQLADSLISDKRGAITDRNGVVLAQSVQVATIILDPDAIPDENIRQTICEELPPLLGIDREKLEAKTRKTSSQYEIVAQKIDEETRDRFIDWAQERGFSGLFRVLQDYKRVYPFGSVLSCVLGFTGTDNTGLEGLEALYNDQLAGKAGRVITTKNGWGDPLPNDLQYETTIDAVEGNTLTLTVDVNIQQMLEKQLAVSLSETAAGNRVCGIVMDVTTGEILAMATKGDYDLNDPRTLTNPDVAARIAALAENERAPAYVEALQKQWKNKPISEFYEPGSVFKIFTVSMALEEGLVSESSHFFCNGTFTMPGVRMMKCHVYPRSHGDQTLAQAISHSCNPAFMKIGSLVGGARFAAYHQQFGFTSLTGVDMLGEARVTESLYHTANAITPVDVATSSIGQTFKVTPIQVITGVSAVAGGGELHRPYVVGSIRKADGTPVKTVAPTVQRQVLSRDTASRVCALLEGVVDGGGAKNAYLPGYRVAGKTGTSEKTDQKGVGANGRKTVVASFCGFAPADDPKIAVLVLVDEPQTAIRYGGTLAAPLAARVLAEVLPYSGITPRYKAEEEAALLCRAPALIGLTPAAATAKAKEAGLTVSLAGNGDRVVAQVPAAGETLSTGGTILLCTDGVSSPETTVPAVTGQTLAVANRQLTAAGCNIRLEGWLDRDAPSVAARQARVAAQSAPAGTAVPKGTVITLTLRYEDAIE